jgi:hypothetical protein
LMLTMCATNNNSPPTPHFCNKTTWFAMSEWGKRSTTCQLLDGIVISLGLWWLLQHRPVRRVHKKHRWSHWKAYANCFTLFIMFETCALYRFARTTNQ